MALYEYKCSSCGTTFDKRMPMSEVKQLMPCPKCKKKARKTIGNFAVVGVAEASFGDGPAPWEDDDDMDMGGFGEAGMPDMPDMGGIGDDSGHSHGPGGHSH